MAQTFSNWNDVPAEIQSKINAFWNGYDTSCHKQGKNAKGEEVTIYELASWRVADNLHFLTDAQKIKLFDITADKSIILHNLLHSLTFERECVSIHSEIYYIPGIIVGTWPHCNLFGGMDEDGYIHT